LVTAEAGDSVPHVATILICDDEAPMRQLIAASLDGSGYTVLQANDGATAVELARSHRPDAVVLDVMLPDRSGLDVLAEIRAEPTLANVRVIILTARAQRSDHDAALAAGADLFMAKPFRPSQLVDELARLVGGV
jgi:two-component system, OmpR family, response regulator MtrA